MKNCKRLCVFDPAEHLAWRLRVLARENGRAATIRRLLDESAQLQTENATLRERLKEQSRATQEPADRVRNAVVEVLRQHDALPPNLDSQGHPVEQVVSSVIVSLSRDRLRLAEIVAHFPKTVDGAQWYGESVWILDEDGVPVCNGMPREFCYTYFPGATGGVKEWCACFLDRGPGLLIVPVRLCYSTKEALEKAAREER